MKTDFTTPGETDVVAVRTFAAPRARVWAAYTQPEHVRRWLALPHSPMLVCEIDLRVGGAYSYRWALPDGSSFGFSGTFLEIEAPARLVTTELYAPAGDEPPPVGYAVNTLELTEDGSRTVLRLLMRYPSRAVRDAVLASGMTGGLDTTLTNLEVLAQELSMPTATQ